MTTNYFDDDPMQQTPQSHDELEVDYDILSPKARIIIAIACIAFLAILVFFCFQSK